MELRTIASGIDPGLVRLQTAGVAVASMALAVGVLTVIRTVTNQPITVVLIAAVLAMISNLAVNETSIARMRVTTALMIVPAVLAVAGGTLLAPYRIPADVVFVAIMIGAVFVRRAGPRGMALGMGAVMGYFFTQFLQASVAQLPTLMVAATIGVLSTLVLRGWVLVERPQRTLERMLRAFRAHVHGLLEATDDLLAADPADHDQLAHLLRTSAARQTRMNETALLVVERLDRLQDPDRPGDHGGDHGGDRAERQELELLDAELAAERLAITTRRLVVDTAPLGDDARRWLRAGLQALRATTATGTPPGRSSMLLDSARTAVAPLVGETDGLGDRAQRVGFAVARLADTLDPDPDRHRPIVERVDLPEPAEPVPVEPPAPSGLAITTRQSIQVGVATTLAIIGGELVSPARWYWAVLTAFVVFTGTTSRGDVLARGYERLLGTIGGVLAGMALAVVVGGNTVAALVLLFGCAFLALYLVRVSQALMAFWITAVLALLYGIIGQFSVATLVLRIAETGVGAAAGMLAGYLVLPTRTREAFGEALDTVVDTADHLLAAGIDHVLGRAAPPTVEVAREMDDALAVLRSRARPLDSPLPWRRDRSRSSYARAVRVFAAVDHYARRLARAADSVTDPDWAPTLQPAAERTRANIDGLRRLLHDQGHRGDERDPAVVSAEELVDAAEAHAARSVDPTRRAELLTVVRLLRRTDQVVVNLARTLGGVAETERAEA